MRKQKIYLLVFIIPTFFLTRCASENVRAEKTIEQLMPPVPASFSSADSARLMANWKLGIKMYKAECARCHGIFYKGKDSIPNFSKQQYDDYMLAFLAGDSTNHAVIAKMTPEEMNAVYLFLTDLKRE